MIDRVMHYVPGPRAPGEEAHAIPGGGKRRARAQVPKSSPLTIRSIAQIAAHKLREDELIFANGYLSKGGRSTMLGQGGIGKSRLAVQAMLCARAGKPFLNWTTQGKELRYLILQTENGNRRLKVDLEHMRHAFSQAEWEHIEKGVFFHTLEADSDGILLLDEPEHFARAEAALLECSADVVVIDPLRDFHSGNLNDDHEMTLVTRNATRLMKAGGRTDRSLLVLHHAKTGKAGIAKAMGFDRGDFGRNSKILHGWTRAQINVAPGSPDDCNTLVVTSGKMNDHPEFAPFAVTLNPQTMTYHLDAEFDPHAWKAKLEGAKQDDDVPAEVIEEVLRKCGQIEKRELVEQVMKLMKRGRRSVENSIKLHSGTVFREFKESRSGRRHAVMVELVSVAVDDNNANTTVH